MDDLFNLPQLQEEKVRMALSIILQTSSAMYFSNPLLLAVMGQKGIRLSLKYGYSAESGGLYSMYGLILIGKLRDHEQGMRFCELSLRITEKYGNSSLYARSHCLLYTLMGHWKYSMCNIPPKIMESYRLCIAVGETEFAAYTLLQYINHCLFVGINMPELLKQANTFTSQIRSMSQDNVLMHLKIPHQTILNLMGQNDVPYSLKGEILDEDTIKTHFKRTQDKIGLFVIHVRQILLSYLFGRYDLALQESIQAKKYVDVVMGIMEIPVFYFFDTLTRLAVLNKTSGRERLSHLLVIRKNKKMLRKWANMAPDNYAGKFYLVEAEAHRCSGDSGKAHECYQQAIRLAVKNGFQSDLALGYELAGRFYHDQEQRELAHFFLQHAYHAYHTWGATAKVLHLEKLYTDIKWHGISTDYIPQTAKSPLCSTWRDQSASTSNLSLDWQSVVKAAQTLSKEINLDKLLKQLMQMVIENAGAEHGYLFLPEDETWNIAAQGHADQEVRTDLPDAENLSDIMSMAIIKYVIRAKEYVVLDDAMNKGSFTHDDHIQQHRVKSVLCIPLISQGKLNGILYLENNLTTGAFSRDRLAVLKVLASQAAISIENAGLYDQLAGYNRTLEAKVAERTRELTIAREKAETANQAKSAFLTNMSHELRSPLNAILGYAGIMSNSSTLSRENRENAGVITRSGKHLLTLINQVLDLSKIEAGRTTLSNTDFNIHHLLHEVEEMFALKAENKHLQLVFERDDAVPQYIHADEIRLRQVLINLLNNAIKFTDKGGVAVRIKVKGEGSKVKGQRLKVKGEGTKSKGEEQDAESLSPLTLHL